jgi:hypothetical protein
MRVRIETTDKIALSSVITSLLDSCLPPNWTVRASFGKDDEEYWFDANYFPNDEPPTPVSGP